jgi:hypothetical protein
MMMTYHSKKTTQKDIILDYLRKNKRITSWFAIEEFGITRLADIVHRLKREGHRIGTTMMTHKNARTGKVSNFAKYTYEDAIDVGSNYELTLG